MAFENLKSTGIGYLLGKLKTHLEATYLKIANAILTVNGVSRDEYGNVQINRVNYAGDLESSFSQNSDETFLQRTSGGTASIVDGDAWLAAVMGNSVHTGFVEEVLEMEVRETGDDGGQGRRRLRFRRRGGAGLLFLGHLLVLRSGGGGLCHVLALHGPRFLGHVPVV